jgi:hypothetical protein
MITKQEIIDESDGRCFYCGVEVGSFWHAEHMIPRSRGGGYTKENIVVSCPKCNMRKNNRNVIEFKNHLKKRTIKRIENVTTGMMEILSDYLSEKDVNEIISILFTLMEKIDQSEIMFHGEVNNGRI